MASSKPRTYFQGNKQLIRELIQLSQQNRREDLLPLGRSFFLYLIKCATLIWPAHHEMTIACVVLGQKFSR